MEKAKIDNVVDAMNTLASILPEEILQALSAYSKHPRRGLRRDRKMKAETERSFRRRVEELDAFVAPILERGSDGLIDCYNQARLVADEAKDLDEVRKGLAEFYDEMKKNVPQFTDLVSSGLGAALGDVTEGMDPGPDEDLDELSAEDQERVLMSYLQYARQIGSKLDRAAWLRVICAAAQQVDPDPVSFFDTAKRMARDRKYRA